MSRQGRFRMTELVISQIKPNRKRNFDVYPVKDEVVEGLMESYRRSGDFGLIPVREIANGRYEQACGHHRLEAMKRLGFLKVAVKIANFSDEEMTRIMIDENATQYGANPAACADSVLAIATDVAYHFFLAENVGLFAEISANNSLICSTEKAFAKIKGKLQKGDITGDVVCVALGGKWQPNGHAKKGDSPLSPDAIDSALQGLKADDHLANKVFAEQKRANAKLAADDAAERRRQQLAEEKAEKLRLAEEQARKLEIARLEAEHEAKVNRQRQRKLEAAERKKADAERKKEQAKLDELRKEAEAAKAEAQLDRDRRAAAARKEEHDRLEKIEKEKELREKARKKAEENKYLAGGTQAMFENNAQFDMFRSIVKKNAQYFPIPEQKSLIETMLDTLGKSEDGGDIRHKVSAEAIRKYLAHEVGERNKELKAINDKAEAEKIARKDAQAISNKARRLHDKLDRDMRETAADVAAILAEGSNVEFVEAFMALPHTRYTYGNLRALERDLPKLLKLLGVAERSISPHVTVDNVVDSQ